MLRSISTSLLILNFVFGGIGLIAVVYMIYAFKKAWPVDINILIATKMTNITIDVGCSLHYLMVLSFHPVLGKQVRRLFQCAQFWRRKMSISSMPELASRNIVARQELDVYFKDLVSLFKCLYLKISKNQVICLLCTIKQKISSLFFSLKTQY